MRFFHKAVEYVAYTLSVIALASLLVWLLMPNAEIGEDMLAEVSGYYGPGSVFAWLLLSINNIEIRTLAAWLWRGLPFRKEQAPERVLYQTQGSKYNVDMTLFGSIAYPFVALGDIITRCSGNSARPACAQSRIEAPLAVVQMALTMSIYANMGDIMISSKVVNCNSGRTLVWRCTWIVAMIASTSADHTADWWLRLFFQGWLTALGFFGVGSVRPDDPDFPPVSFKLCSHTLRIFMYIFGFAALASLTTDSQGKKPWRIAFPRSSARITDLDQAAALAIALFTLGIPFMRLTFRRSRSRRGLTVEDVPLMETMDMDEEAALQDER